MSLSDHHYRHHHHHNRIESIHSLNLIPFIFLPHTIAAVWQLRFTQTYICIQVGVYSYFCYLQSHSSSHCYFQALLSFVLRNIEWPGWQHCQSKISTTVVSMSLSACLYYYYLHFYISKHFNSYTFTQSSAACAHLWVNSLKSNTKYSKYLAGMRHCTTSYFSNFNLFCCFWYHFGYDMWHLSRNVLAKRFHLLLAAKYINSYASACRQMPCTSYTST